MPCATRCLGACRSCGTRRASVAGIDEFLAELDAEPDLAPGFTDKDLYDENGDPIP